MKKQITKSLALVAALGLAVTAAHAGTDTDFDDISAKLAGWSSGSLGKTVSIASFVIGVAAGIARQSLMAAATGVGTALVSNYGPGTINKVMTATI